MTTASYQAPGRVNLMGDHTDYNHGLVLPIVIDLQTTAEISSRDDQMVHIWSKEYSNRSPTVYQLGEEKVQGEWFDYIQGVTYTLQRHGYIISGFNLSVSSEIPIGSGLSSSAALEVSILRALRQLYALDFNDLELAKLAQKVETEFVGAPIGIMDQMVISLGSPDEALYINTSDLSYQKVPLSDNTEIVIINSGIAHKNATGGYSQRRRECSEAAELLKVDYLSDLTVEQLEDSMEHLAEPLGRRVKHVVCENQRVIQMEEAMNKDDFKTLRKVLYESHDSLRDDYEVSIPEIDLLVNLSLDEEDVIGARLTGGGFGGSIVMLCFKGKGRQAATRIIEKAVRQLPFSPRII